MSYQANTITRTNEITHTDVRNVMWKIKSDMCQLRIFHSTFDTEYEEKMAFDLFQWTYRGFADNINFEFYHPSSYDARFAIHYRIIRGQISATNDSAGTIPYLDLKGTSFRLQVIYSQAWKDLTSQEKNAFYRDLKFQWGDSTFEVRYSNGSWTDDKMYSSNSLGAGRSIYKA